MQNLMGSPDSLIKPLTRWLTAGLTLLMLAVTAQAQNDMRVFITRNGDRLLEGDKEYRFISFNIPNLHLVEDNMRFAATNEWRFPDEFEITDALTSVKQMGGRAVRTYVISICRNQGANAIPCHITRPGQFNEEAFRALDRVLDVANRVGVRVVIPLVDNWKWWGGAAEYAAWRGKPAAAFWTDREVISDFKQTVSYVINRRNTINGTLYKDDKAILAWETGNELDSPYSWTKEIAATIKSLDKNHLVWDGYYIGSHKMHTEALSDPNIDIVSSHHYPGANRGPGAMAADVEKFARQISGKRPYVVGEFGFVPLSEVEKVLETVIRTGAAGAMVWSLRFHNRDGGFYWHTEGASSNAYKAYHYPGFAPAKSYQETELLKLMRAKAFEIRGLAAPPVEAPAPPVLLPIKSAAEISWQGAVGACLYDVERATAATGPWTLVGFDIDDSWAQYRQLFADDYAEPGNSYYYRVRAKNSAGASAPSNVVGPVRVEANALVDELSDYSRLFARDGKLTLETGNPRPYKEDAHRLKGGAGNWVIYRTRQPLRSARVLAFMEGAEQDFEFYLSEDGLSFVKMAPTVSRYPTEINPYGYKLPVQYDLTGVPPARHFLKIVFRTDAQISRVELRHGKTGVQ